MRPGRLAVTSVTAVALLVGCTAAPGGDGPEVGSTVTPIPTATAASSSAPSSVPPSSTSPTPSTTLPSRSADAAALRRALVGPADLGKPWVPIDSPPDRDEACPGTPSAVSRLAIRADVRRDLTRGAGELVNGASFRLATLPGPDATAVRAAWASDTRACRQYTDPDGFYVVYDAAEPTAVRGADEVLLRRAERVYFDREDDEPAYARHTLVARTGRVVVTVVHSFLTAAGDPDATDFGPATDLLQTQLRKAAKHIPT